MKKTERWKRVLSIALSGILVAGAVCPEMSAEAAAKPVSLSKTKIVLKVGKTKTIKVKKSRGVKIKGTTFRSTKKKVATVTKKGKIVAKKSGMTTIKVKVKYKKGKKTTTKTLNCKVKVTGHNSDTARTNSNPTSVVSPSQSPSGDGTTPSTSQDPDNATHDDGKAKVTRLTWIKELVAKLDLEILKESDLTKKISVPMYSFEDIGDTSDALVVETAVRNGLISEEEIVEWEEKFQPDSVIDQEYALVTALRGLGYCGELVEITCNGLNENANYPEYDQIAIEKGMLQPNENGSVDVHKELLVEDKDKILEKVENLQSSLSDKLENKDNSVYSEKYNDKAIPSDVQYSIEKEENQYAITISSDFVRDLEVDQTFYLPKSEACPDGVMFIAKDIRQDGTNVIILAEVADSLDDVFKKVDIQGNVDITAANFEPAENVTIEENSLKSVDKKDKQLGRIYAEGSEELELKLEDPDLGPIDIHLGKPSLNYIVDIGFFNIRQLKVSLSQTTTVSCEMKGAYNTSKLLGTIKEKIGGGTLTIAAKLYAEFSVEGEVSLDVEMNVEAGIDYVKNTGMQKIFDMKYTKDISAEVDAKAGLKFALELRAFNYEIWDFEINEGKLIVDVGVEGGVEVSAGFQNHTSTDLDDGGGSLTCFDFQLNPYLTLFVGDDEDSLLRKWVLDKPLDYDIWNKESAPENMTIAYHMEGLNGQPLELVDFCTYMANGEGDGWKLENGILTITKIYAYERTGEDVYDVRYRSSGWRTYEEFVKAIIVDADVILLDNDKQVVTDKNIKVSMFGLFSRIPYMQKIKIKKLDITQVVDFQGLFAENEKLESIRFPKIWNTSNVTNMSYLFDSCSSLTKLNIGSWDTSNVTDMSYMFERCSSLNSLDIGKWNTNKLETMFRTFADCSNLRSINLSKWTVQKDTDIRAAFYGCTKVPSFLFAESWKSTGEAMHRCFPGEVIYDLERRRYENGLPYLCLKFNIWVPEAYIDFVRRINNTVTCVEYP